MENIEFFFSKIAADQSVIVSEAFQDDIDQSPEWSQQKNHTFQTGKIWNENLVNKLLNWGVEVCDKKFLVVVIQPPFGFQLSLTTRGCRTWNRGT